MIYYLRIDDFAAIGGDEPDLAFTGKSPDALAGALQTALTESDLFAAWRDRQADPDAVDPALAAVDPHARVHAEQVDLSVDMQVETELSMQVLRHRLELLVGPHWTVHDVR